MDQLLKTHMLPKLNQDELEGPHTPTATKDTEFGNRFPRKRNPQAQMALLENFIKH